MTPHILKDCNAFVDGEGYVGRVKELELPKISLKTEEGRYGGMDAPIEHDMGMEKLEPSMTCPGIEPEILKRVALSSLNGVQWTFRGSHEDDTGSVQAVVVNLTGRIKSHEPGNWKPGESVDNKYVMAAVYYKLTVDGTVIHEIDVLNAVRIIDGVDQLTKRRAALGLD